MGAEHPVWEPCLDEEHQLVEAFQDVGEEAWADRPHRSPREQDEDEEAFQVGDEAFRDEGEEAWTGRLGSLLRHSPQQGQDVGAEAFLDQDAV